MKTSKEIMNGCQCFLEEDDFQEEDGYCSNLYCGNKRNERIFLCPTCQAKLSVLQQVEDVIDKLANKVKANEVDIGEYDKFISVHKLKQALFGDKYEGN